MKVLMICTEKLPVPPVRGGAIQTYIQGIYHFLCKHHKLTILGVNDPLLPDEEYSDNVRFVRVKGKKTLSMYSREVSKFLQSNSFDLIHIFNRPRFVMPVRRAAPHSRIILSMHNDMFIPEKIIAKEAVQAIQEVETIITVSDYVGRKIKEFYPQAEPKLRTIYSGVDIKRFIPWQRSKQARQIREKLRSKYNLDDKNVILFVGRLTQKKGADVLLRSMYELHDLHSNTALVLVGGTWYDENIISDYVAYVRALAKRSPIPVITTGYVLAKEVHQWFLAGDIFVCPSQWEEPLARVHYEAMASGLPFLTTARGGNPELVKDNTGLLVENPEDPREFAKHLRRLLANEKVRNRMGNRGREMVEKSFDWKRVAREVLEVWKG